MTVNDQHHAGLKAQLGAPTTIAGRTVVPYSISGVPFNDPVELAISSAIVDGTFMRDGNPINPVAAECTSAQPTVSGFNYHAVSPPR